MGYLTPFQGIGLYESTFRHQINKKTGEVDERRFVFDRHFGDGGDQLPVEADRYRLIWMPGCPHSNKAVITLRLLGLDRVISIGECGVLRDPRGWVFDEDLGGVDPVLKIHYLDDAYLKGDPEFTGRSTVPAIVDVTTGACVQNEAWDIPRYLITDWRRFHKEQAPDLYPEDLREEIDEWSALVNGKVNAYACGFARSQEKYEAGYAMYFDILDRLEERLASRRFVHGDFITLTDIHLYVALIRFHINYHLIFGVNKKRLEDYPNLWGYTRDLYQTEAFYEYTKLDLIKKHYQLSPHMRAKFGNVYGLTGVGPDNSQLLTGAGREKLSSHPDEKFRYESESRPQFTHDTVEKELQYLQEYLLYPVERAAAATFQTDLDRWAYNERDTLRALEQRLSQQPYLLGDTLSDADVLLYQSLLRHDHIWYYLYKLNFAKSRDFTGLRNFVERLGELPEVKASINIEAEKRKAYLDREEERNPYGLVYSGPEWGY